MRWLVSTDDSDYSMKAIQEARSLMVEGDTLSIFSKENHNASAVACDFCIFSERLLVSSVYTYF